RHSFKAGGLHAFFESGSVLLLDGAESKQVHRKFLRPGNVVLVEEGQVLPGDGTALEGPVYLNTAFMDGESIPKRIEKGARALAGSINAGKRLPMRLLATGEGTELGKGLVPL